MTSDQLQVEIDISSRFENIDLVDLVTDAMLRHAGLDDESVERMGLAIREAVANGVQHGNQADPDKRVTVSFLLNQKELTIAVRDEGEGFDLDTLPDPLAPENLYKSRGRGILLMNSFMDQIDWDFEGETGTLVTMRKRLGTRAPEKTKEDAE